MLGGHVAGAGHDSAQALGANEPCAESRSADFVLADLCGKPLGRTGTVVTAKQKARPTNPRFTPLQGQYLAFIRTYTLLHREPPAEMDMQHFFRVTPPSIHNMVLTLEARGLIERVPGKARTIRVLVPLAELPPLHDPTDAGKNGAA